MFLAGFVADVFIFAVAMEEQIGFHEGVRGGHAPAAHADLDGATVVLVGVGEIIEKVIVNPGALGHLIRARAVDDDHLAHGGFVLKRVMIDFSVVATDHEVVAVAGELKGAAGVSDVAGAGHDLFAAGVGFFVADRVGELESFNDDISGGRFQLEALTASDFRAAVGFGQYRNGLPLRAFHRDVNDIGRGVNSVGEDDFRAGCCVGNRGLQGG